LIKGKTYVNDNLVCEGEFKAKLVKKHESDNSSNSNN